MRFPSLCPVFRSAVLSLPVLSLTSMAQEVAADAPPPARGLAEVLQSGGWPMIVLGGMSIVGLAFVIYFFVVLRREQIIPSRFVAHLGEVLQQGRLDEARGACLSNPSPVAAIARVAMDYQRRTEEPDPAMLKEVIEGEGGRQATLLQNQIQYLLDVGVIAPMVGLLGTVIGMLGAFDAVALDLAKAKPMLLAGGVSQALITTAAGLIVGIPAMAFYSYFRGRTTKLIAQLEMESAELLALLVHAKK